MMPVGPILLTILIVLVYFGFLDGFLARVRISDRTAMLLAAGMLLGSLVEVPLARGLTVNLGGGIIPVGLALYSLASADQWFEPLRAGAGAVVTAGAVFLTGRFFPPWQPTELNLFYLDAQYLFGLVAGVVGYLAGQSRRAAFCAGVLGVLLGDLAHYARIWPGGPPFSGIIRMGGGGFQQTAVVAGVIAVALVEWIGEVRESSLT